MRAAVRERDLCDDYSFSFEILLNNTLATCSIAVRSDELPSFTYNRSSEWSHVLGSVSNSVTAWPLQKMNPSKIQGSGTDHYIAKHLHALRRASCMCLNCYCRRTLSPSLVAKLQHDLCRFIDEGETKSSEPFDD
jgi:hypothetical protein